MVNKITRRGKNIEQSILYAIVGQERMKRALILNAVDTVLVGFDPW
jgi:Mg-chelatase subunit ChlI